MDEAEQIVSLGARGRCADTGLALQKPRTEIVRERVRVAQETLASARDRIDLRLFRTNAADQR